MAINVSTVDVHRALCTVPYGTVDICIGTVTALRAGGAVMWHRALAEPYVEGRYRYGPPATHFCLRGCGHDCAFEWGERRFMGLGEGECHRSDVDGHLVHGVAHVSGGDVVRRAHVLAAHRCDVVRLCCGARPAPS